MNDLTNVSSTASRNASPESLVDRLFQKLHTMYGKLWADMWVGAPMDAVKAEWARTLTGVEPEAMRLALDAILKAGKPFPPTLPEFTSLCRQFARTGSHRLMLMSPRQQAPADAFQSLRNILRKAK